MKKQVLFATFIFTFFQVFLTSAQTTYQTYNDNNYQNGCDNLIPIENGHVAYTYNSYSNSSTPTLVLGWNTSDPSFNPGQHLFRCESSYSYKLIALSDPNLNLVDDPFSSDPNQKLLILPLPNAAQNGEFKLVWSNSYYGSTSNQYFTGNVLAGATRPAFYVYVDHVAPTAPSITNDYFTNSTLNFSGTPSNTYKVISTSTNNVLASGVIPLNGNFSINLSSLGLTNTFPPNFFIKEYDEYCNPSSNVILNNFQYPTITSDILFTNTSSPLFTGTGLPNTSFNISVKKGRDFNSLDGICTNNCSIESGTVNVNSNGIWNYQVTNSLLVGDYQLIFDQFNNGTSLTVPSSQKNFQIRFAMPQAVTNITPVLYNENQTGVVFPFSTFQTLNLDGNLTDYVKLEIVPPADYNQPLAVGYNFDSPGGSPELYTFSTNVNSSYLSGLLSSNPSSYGGSLVLGNSLGTLSTVGNWSSATSRTYSDNNNTFTLLGTNGDRIKSTWVQAHPITGNNNFYNWSLTNETSFTSFTNARYEGYNVPTELSVIPRITTDLVSHQVTANTVVENCIVRADEVSFKKNGNEYTPLYRSNDFRAPEINSHDRLRIWEITSILHSISYSCTGDLIDANQNIARPFKAKLYKADGTFDVINATVNLVPSPDMGYVNWGGIGVTLVEGDISGSLRYTSNNETTTNDNITAQQTFTALLSDNDFNSTLTVDVETSTGFEHTVTQDIPNNTKTYTCLYYTLTVPITISNSNTTYSGQSVYMPFVINYTDFDQFTALNNPINTLRFKFYSPDGTYTGWVGNNITFGFVIDDIIFNATPNYSSANSITNLPTSSLFTVNSADFVDGDLSQKGFKSVTLKIKDAQRFLDEIVFADGSDMLITKNATGTTSSGYTWVNTLTNSSTATLKINFPTALTNAQLTTFINSIVYKIKFGSLNKWTDGIRSVEIVQIEKYASSNNVKDYNLNFVSELNVVGNADIYFENYNVTFNPFYEHNSVTALTGFVAPTNYSGYTLTFSPDGNQDNVADMLSYDVYDFSSADVSTSNGAISVNGTVVGNFVIANNKIIVTFSGGTTAQVDKVIKALKFSVNTNDPTYRGIQVLWDLTNSVQQVNSGTFFLVVPENDAPLASTSLTTQLLYRTETNSTYGVSIFDNNTFVIQQNLFEQNQDEPQKLKKIKINIKNLSSATVLRNSAGQIIPCEYLLYNNQQIPIGRVENYQSAGYATSYTYNGLNFDFEYVGATEVNVMITDNDVNDNVNLLTELLTLKYYANTTNAISSSPVFDYSSSFAITSTRQFRVTYLEDSGFDDGVRNNNQQTISSNNFIELRFDPSARNNSPYITNTLNLATNWNPKTAGNPTETTFTWLGPGTIYGQNAASYNSSSVLEYQASKGSKLLWNMSGYLSPGFEDVGQFVSQIKVKVTNILDPSMENIQIGTTTINLNANSSGTLLLSGVTINYSSVYASNVSEITFSGFTATVKPEALLNMLKYGHSSATPTIGQRTIFISELKDNVNDAFSNSVIDYTVSTNWSGKLKINVITPIPDAFSVSWNASYAYGVIENSSTTAAMVLKVNGNPTTSYPFTYNGVSCLVHKISFKNSVTNSEILDSRLRVNVGTSGKIVKDPVGLSSGYYLILPIANNYNNDEYTITLSTINNGTIDGNYSATISIYDASNAGNTSFNSIQPNYILGDVPTISVTDDDIPTFTATTNTLSVVEGQTVTVDLSINIFPASNNQSYELDMTNSGTNARLGISPAYSYFRRVTGTPNPVDTKTVTVTFTAPQNTNLDGNTTVPVTFTLADLYYLNGTSPNYTRGSAAYPSTTPFSGMTQIINVTVIDDDVPLILPSVSQIVVSEASGTNSGTGGIKLSAAPDSNKTISLSSTSSAFTFSPTTMTFTPSNWNIDQTVTVTSVNNSIIDGTKTGTISLTDTSGVYNQPYPITVNVTDDDATLSITSLNNNGTYPTVTSIEPVTSTSGTLNNPDFQLVLPAQPTNNVVVSITPNPIVVPVIVNGSQVGSNSYSILSLSSNTITFTTSNWNIPQTITLNPRTTDAVNGSTLNYSTLNGKSSTLSLSLASSTATEYQSLNYSLGYSVTTTSPPASILVGANHSFTNTSTGGSDNKLDMCEKNSDGTLRFLLNLTQASNSGMDITNIYLSLNTSSGLVFSNSNSAAPNPAMPSTYRLISMPVSSTVLTELWNAGNSTGSVSKTYNVKYGLVANDATNGAALTTITSVISVDPTILTCASSDTTSPLITGPSGVAGSTTSAKSIAENSTLVHTFTSNETASWSLNGGEDVAKFSINSSGVLQFIVAPNYENPTDGSTSGINTYIVIVKCTDSAGNISNQTVTVTVTDLDEIAPTAPVLAASNGTSVTGTAEANSSVIISITSGGTTTTTTVTADSSGNFTYTPSPALSNGTTLTATATDASGNVSSVSNTVTVTLVNTWSGSSSTSWNNASNWSIGIPSSGQNVDIPLGLSNYPVLNGPISLGNIQIANGATLNLNNTILTITGVISGTGTIIGSATSNLIINGTGNQGTIYMNQTTPGTSNTIANFTLNSGSTGSVQLGNAMGISEVLTLTNGAFITNGNLTLMSNATSTAVVAPISDCNSVTITGDVTVERFIPARRAFRFITSPVTTSTTIRENWQEGVNNLPPAYSSNLNPNPGYGTHITGNITSDFGFDVTETTNNSMFTFNNNSGAWASVPNTNVLTLSAGIPYRLLIRGDRSISMSSNTPTPTNTILRAKGALKICDATVGVISPVAEGYNFIGNPYQAVVDIKQVLTQNAHFNNNYYWVWDPKINTRGGYVAYDLANNQNPVSGSQVNQYLQPWQACFIKNDATAGGSITFHESNKITAVVNNVYRNTNVSPNIRATLYETATMSLTGVPIDGIIINFDENYSNLIDADDAPKLNNQDEIFATKNEATLLAIEKRNRPVVTDVIPLSITQYRNSNYTLVVQGNDMGTIRVYLHDQWLQTYTEIPSTGLIHYPFTINTTDAASLAPDRFRIVFQNPLLYNNNVSVLNFSLHPNPSSQGKFDVLMTDATIETELLIYNSMGQEVYQTYLKPGSINHICPNKVFAKGVYFVKIVKDGITKIEKLIIE